METLILMFDTVALMVAIYFSVRNEKSPGKDEAGPFRIKPFIRAPEPSVTKKRGARRL